MTLKPFAILWPAMGRYRRDLLLALFAAAIGQAVAITLPLVARGMIHRVTPNHHHGKQSVVSAARIDHAVLTFGSALGGLAIARGVLRWQQGMRSQRAAQLILADVRSDLYCHLQGISQGFFDRRPAGKVLIRFIGDANALRTWLSQVLVTVPGDVISVIYIAFALALIRFELLLAVAIPIILVVPLLLFINPRARRWTREGRRSQSRLCHELSDRLSGMAVIKATNSQEADANEVRSIIQRIATASISRARMDAWSQSLSVSATVTSLGAVCLWGTVLFGKGSISHGDLLSSVWLALLARSPVSRLTSANVIHQRARVAVERIGELLARPTEGGTASELSDFKEPVKSIEFRRVSYKGVGGKWALRRFSAALEGPGVFLVSDQSGHAKSTFLELLLRLRRPHKGKILLNGQSVAALRTSHVRRSFGWVPRERKHLSKLAHPLRAQPGTPDYQRLEQVWGLTTAIAPKAAFEKTLQDMHLEAGHRIRWDVALRLSVSLALWENPSVLLLDDPSAHLSSRGVQQLKAWLAENGLTKIIIVASNDERLESTAVRQIELRHSTRRRPMNASEQSRRRAALTALSTVT